MHDLVAPLALLGAVDNAVAAVLGALHARAFWILVRVAQAMAVLLAAFAGLAAATGDGPDDGLFWLYAVLPLAVALIGEQLRLASAETVLEAHGLPDAQAMPGLSEDEQRAILASIVHREEVVM